MSTRRAGTRRDPNDSLLAEKVTVAKYHEWEANRNRREIAKFIYQRFTERYLKPISNTQRNGFTIMAICCLTIEALESFQKGWPDTEEWEEYMFMGEKLKTKRGQAAFYYFFSENPYFNDFQAVFKQFYKCVRCGILHQAETTGGWHIRRDEPSLFNHSTKTIDATLFFKGVQQALLDYRKNLEISDWDSDMWVKLRNKMDQVCKNCAE